MSLKEFEKDVRKLKKNYKLKRFLKYLLFLDYA